MTAPAKVNLAAGFASFDECWSPLVAAEMGDVQIKLVKLQGAFHWHHHTNEDELFLIVAGRLRMAFRDRDVDLDPGELIVVPRGVEHRPEALTEPCHVMLVEPNSVLNTGNIENERTVRDLARLA